MIDIFKKYIILCMMIFIVPALLATEKNRLYTKITIPLSYYPVTCSPLPVETNSYGFRQGSIMGMYLVGNEEDSENSQFMQYSIGNNLRLGSIISNSISLVPEKIVLNKEPDQPNPLLSNRIKLFDIMNKSPLIVMEGLPASLCLIENLAIDASQTMVITPTLNDANGNPSDGIIAMTSGFTGIKDFDLSMYVFAAVKKQGGDFGQDGSGIAVIKYDKNVIKETTTEPDGTEKETERKEYFLNILNAQSGESHGNRAVELNNKLISINNGVGFVEANIIDLCWNPYVERLYIALHVKNSDSCASDQGSMALLIGRLDENERLCLDPIAADSIFVGNNAMVGACGPNQVSLHKLRSIITTTGFPYLLVVGGVGHPEQTSKMVYALPLTDRSLNRNRNEIMADPLHGTIANTLEFPRNVYAANKRGPKLIGRAISNPAQTIYEMPIDSDRATCVGASVELPNTITDCIVVGDAVYVTVAQGGAQQHPGIFHSQPIFDGMGKIAAWTPWQRIAGIQEGVKTAYIASDQYFLSYLRSQAPELVCQVSMDISRSKNLLNNEMSGDLSDLIENIFKQDGGVQGLFDFSSRTPGLSGDRKVSMLVASGYKKIVLIESGSDDNDGTFNAYQENFIDDLVLCDQGIIPEQLQQMQSDGKRIPRVLVITGGVLEELGAITCATIIHDSEQAWLVVGGVRGIGVLAHKDGTGWSLKKGLLPGFAGIDQEMSFKKFGTYSFVKKIVSNEGSLYIVSKAGFERVSLTSDALVSGKAEGTILARSENVGALLDIGVSGPLTLLATSRGLWVNGNQTDCRYSKDAATMQWTLIDLPYSLGPVYNLFFVTSNGQSNGFGHKGQVYISSGSLRDNETEIYRLYCDDVYIHGVTEKSVQLVPDQKYITGPCPLFALNSFRDFFVTDGVHHFSARSRQMNERPFLHELSLQNIKSPLVREPIMYDVPLHVKKNIKTITAVVQNSATGNWLIAGDFGLRIYN